jgi:hypothetical protein
MHTKPRHVDWSIVKSNEVCEAQPKYHDCMRPKPSALPWPQIKKATERVGWLITAHNVGGELLLRIVFL